MKTIAIVGVLVGGFAVVGCGSGMGTPGGGAAGTSGAAGTTGGAAGTSSAAGTSGACGKVQPCGGSLVGSWNATAACLVKAEVEDPNLAVNCPTAKIEALSLAVSGTSTFTATTFVNTGTITFQTRFTLPLSCFGAGKDCAGLQATYVEQGNFQSPTCAIQGTSCVCMLKAVRDAAESGAYATSGKTLTKTNAGVTATVPYCVIGNEFHSLEVDMEMPMGPMGMANIAAEVVFTKR